MKNSNYLYLLLALILFVGSSFVIKERIEPSEKAAFTYVKSITNKQLNATIEVNFCSLVDIVNNIEAYSNSELGSYYLVKGQKASLDVTFKLKVTDLEIQNEAYTYIDFESLIANGVQSNQIDYCHWNYSSYVSLL